MTVSAYVITGAPEVSIVGSDWPSGVVHSSNSACGVVPATHWESGRSVRSGNITVDAEGAPAVDVSDGPRFTLETSGVTKLEARGYRQSATPIDRAAASRMDLLSTAERQLARLRGSTANPDAELAVRFLLSDLVQPGQPAPQVTENPAGFLEVNWLVGEDFVGLLANGNEYEIWVESPIGTELYAHAAEGEPQLPRDVALRIRQELAKLGRGAAHWPT